MMRAAFVPGEREQPRSRTGSSHPGWQPYTGFYRVTARLSIMQITAYDFGRFEFDHLAHGPRLERLIREQGP